MASLLMDVGMLVLDDLVGDAYGRISERARGHSDLCKVRRPRSADHVRPGQRPIAEVWACPNGVLMGHITRRIPWKIRKRASRLLVCYLAGRWLMSSSRSPGAHAIVELVKVLPVNVQHQRSDCGCVAELNLRRPGRDCSPA